MLTAGLLSGCVSDAASDSTLPTITVGSDTYPPYVYMDNNGDITGLDVDIAEEAFRRIEAALDAKGLLYKKEE